MIELQDQHVALAAVHALAEGEDVVDVVEIAAYRRREAALRVIDVPEQSRPAGPTRGDAPVAVRAADVAERYLGLDAWPRRPAGHQGTDQLAFLAEMIEIQHAQVPLAAIDTRMCPQVRVHGLASRARATSARDPRLLDVLRAATSKVVAEALATPVLEASARAVERRPRELPLAIAAPFALLVHEHMFACPTDESEYAPSDSNRDLTV